MFNGYPGFRGSARGSCFAVVLTSGTPNPLSIAKRPADASCQRQLILAKDRLYLRSDRSHVGAAPGFCFYCAHNLAHVADAFCAGFGNCLADHRVQFIIGHLLGQVIFDNADLAEFDVCEVIPAAVPKLADRVAALLDHLVKYAEDGSIIKLCPLVDFDLLDCGKHEAHYLEPVFVAGLHGGFHVVVDLALECHGRAGRCPGSVKAFAPGYFPGNALQMALDRCGFLALAFLGWLLVELATAKFSQDTRLFTGALEPAQGSVKILIFLNADTRHTNYCLWFRYKETRHKAGTELHMISAESGFCKAKTAIFDGKA